MARVEIPNSRARSAIAKRSRFSLSRLFSLHPLHRLVLLAQLLLAELADERFGQLVLENDLAWHFKLVETLADEFAQLCLAHGLAGLELDERHRCLAAVLVLDADDVGFIDSRMGEERLFDGARVDVDSSRVDQVLDSIDVEY